MQPKYLRCTQGIEKFKEPGGDLPVTLYTPFCSFVENFDFASRPKLPSQPAAKAAQPKVAQQQQKSQQKSLAKKQTEKKATIKKQTEKKATAKKQTSQRSTGQQTSEPEESKADTKKVRPLSIFVIILGTS